MKSIITLLLTLSVFAVSAQKIELPDDSKVIARSYPTVATPITCGGVAYLNGEQSAQVQKSRELNYLSAGNLDDSKAAQWLLKQQCEKGGIRPAAKTTAATPVVGLTFSGPTPDGWSPLDNSVAVSNAGIIISVENSTIAGYNANTGASLFTTSLHTFLPFTGIYDVSSPVVLYDSTKDRFILFCQEVNASGVFAGNRIFLCFSQTNNPAIGGWWCYSFTGDPAGTGDGFDFPRLGINDSEIFVAGNLYYEPSNIFHKAMLFQMDKLAGFTGLALTSVYYSTIFGSPFTLLPVSYGQGANLTNSMLMVSTLQAGGSYINLYSISGTLAHSPIMSYYTVSTPPYSPPASAMQLGTATTLNTGDCRALSGFFLDGIIHFVFNSAVSGYTGINYNRLAVSTLSNTSSTFSMSGFDCAYPAVASFATSPTDRSVMIGFGRSGSTIAPEIRVVNCDNAMSWSTSTLVKSNAYVTYSGTSARWGDYTGICRRHGNSYPSVWMTGAYGNSGHRWSSWVNEVHTGVLPCPIPTGLTATYITASTALLGWTAVTGALSYNIRYRKVGASTWTTTTSSVTTKSIGGLASSTDYEYQLESVCPSSTTSTFSPSSNFTTNVGASVSTVSAPAGRVYPNPVTDKFAVEFPLYEKAMVNISVVDMTGRLVKELYSGSCASGDNSLIFNKPDISAGIYMLVIKSNEKTIRNEKIIIAD